MISSLPPRMPDPACGPALPSIVSVPAAHGAAGLRADVADDADRALPSVRPPRGRSGSLPPSKTMFCTIAAGDAENVADRGRAFRLAEPDLLDAALVQPGQPLRRQRRQVEPLGRLGDEA